MASPLEFRIVMTDQGAQLGTAPNIPLGAQGAIPAPGGGWIPAPSPYAQPPSGQIPIPPSGTPPTDLRRERREGIGEAPMPEDKLAREIAGLARDLRESRQEAPDVRQRRPEFEAAGAAYQLGAGRLGALFQTMGRRQEVAAGAPRRPGEMPGVAVAQAAAKVVAAAFDTVGQAAKQVGGQMEAIAKNRHLDAFGKSVDGAANVLKKIPIVGEAAASALTAFKDTVLAVGGVVKAFTDRGKELAQFSPELAYQQALNQVAELRADIREAQTLGPDLARLTEREREIDMMMRELLLPIKVAIAEKLVAFLEWLQPVLEELFTKNSATAQRVDFINQTLSNIFVPGLQQTFTVLDGLFGAAQNIDRNTKKDPKADLSGDPLKALMAAVGQHLGRKQGQPALNLPQGGGPLNIPAIQNLP